MTDTQKGPLLDPFDCSLRGRRLLITAGPTYEAIDPVRYIANRSSGKQGYAIAEAAERAGAEVVLISGPVSLERPEGVEITYVESAQDMLNAVRKALPADCAIFAAAVADWRVAEISEHKLKKRAGSGAPVLDLIENPDVCAQVGLLSGNRPQLVVGFAAETENLIENARSKLQRKGCDWIIANDVSRAGNAMGGDYNTVHIVTQDSVESWSRMHKAALSSALISRIALALRD